MPESRKFGKREWIISAVILAALAVVIVAATGSVSSNADYICTRVVEENGDCTNGSWGGWTPVSTDADQNTCVLTETEQRTYTGTRAIRHTLQYLSGRTRCGAGYEEADAGNWNEAWSGFHGGTITSESAACQVVETRRTRSPITTGACAARDPITTTVTTETQTIDGQVSTTREDATAGAFDRFATLDIVARPQLVQEGDTTVVSWETDDMKECTVTGTTESGVIIDTWAGLEGEEVSAPIPERTTFTLACVTIVSETEKTGSVIVDINPDWQET